MKELPSSKGIKPVASSTMLNFVYWLETYHSQDLHNLQYLPDETLFQIITEFERSRPDIETTSSQFWRNSIYNLFQKNNDYRDAKDFIKKIR